MSRRGVAVIAAGFCTLFIAFGIRYSYGLILPYMLTSLGISKTEAGMIFSAYFVTATSLSPFFGFLCDRLDSKHILTIFVAILGIGALLMSQASSVLQAALFFAVAGIGHSACWAPVVTVVMRWVKPQQRGFSVSVVDLGTTVGIATWSLLIPVIIANGGWQAVWVWLGITALAVAALNFLCIKSHPPTPAIPQPAAQPAGPAPSLRDTAKTIFRNDRFYLIGFSYLLISFSILIPFTFMTSFAIQNLTLGYAVASGLLVVIAASGAIGKLALAYLSDRTGRIKIMMLCGLLTATGAALMAYANGFAALLAAAVFFGIGYGSLWAIYAASARDLFDKQCAGAIIGLWTLFHGVGSVFSPILGGWLIDTTGGYYWAFMLAVASSLLASLILLPLLRTEAMVRAEAMA
ncbi:nitrate/nitrite transporter [Malonomonas rubra]|uniref:MFS transporter n=1 Tax=Malonomonas rubra TaxID=57040 RepID=UPI0026EBA323|nr:MFS transporter [Malonomonas rubra]